MLEALGRADTKIKDKKKINEPVKLITDSLHKLENLIDENKFTSENIIKIDKRVLNNLTEQNREQSYLEIDKIRRIAETLKKNLKP